MIQNYLTTAWRTLRRYPGYTLLNTIGLAVGIGVCLLIGLYVRHEGSYDRFHEKADRIARVVQAQTYSNGLGPSSARVLNGHATPPPGLAQALQRQVPGIGQTTVVGRPSRALLKRGEEHFYVDDVMRADTSFFEVFSFELLRSDPKTALDGTGRIVLTKSLARRLFGSADPIGKTIVYENENEYEVADIVADSPANSHFSFEALLSLTEGQREMRYGGTVRGRFYGDYTYLVLRESAEPGSVEDAICTFERNAGTPEFRQGEARFRVPPSRPSVRTDPAQAIRQN